MQDIDEVVEVFPEEEKCEYMRSAENIQKRQNSGSFIDRLVMEFYEKTYKSGNKLFMREQE